MANVIHKTNRNSRGELIQYNSVNTPDYSTANWIHNPDLSGVAGVAKYYWKSSGDTIVEMSQAEKNSVDSSLLDSAKANRKNFLKRRLKALIDNQYPESDQNYFSSEYSSSIVNKPNRKQTLQPWINWVNTANMDLKEKLDTIDSQTTVEGVNAVSLDESTIISNDPGITVNSVQNTSDDTALNDFLDSNAVVTDSTTDISGPFYLMQILNHRKDLYNDSDNPIHDPDHQPILGVTGILNTQANRILNLETIHNKNEWHRDEIKKALYKRPKELLIYYGWVNSFNSASNGWSNEKVALDMAKYGLIVLGDGVQDPSHGDYANTSTIIPRIKEVNPNTLIFGYVTANQNISTFQTKADQWNDLSIDGIFLDESGYDFSVDRSEFNTRVDYVHALSSANIAFANAWTTDHILGTANDASYPNSTYNPSEVESSLNENDWILLESFPINTTSYSGTGGYESKTDWIYRGQKAVNLRNTYNVNFASVGVINNDNANGQDLFNFGFVSSMMWSLDAQGSSDVSYGASSAAVTYWVRPDVSGLGTVWAIAPTIINDGTDVDKYYRYVDYGVLSLDFSDSAQSSTITNY